MQLLFSEISEILNAEAVLVKDGVVHEFKIDSRSIGAGYDHVCFFAIKGNNTDGHVYIKELENKGVSFFVIDNLNFAPSNSNYILVANVLQALQDLAKEARKRSKATVIAITGSNGKTMTKDALVHLFAHTSYNIIASPRSYNSQLGVALSLLQLESNTDFAFIEAGISRTSEMRKLKEMINPDMGILTHLGDAHQSGFKSQEQKIQEKLILFEDCNLILCNSSNPFRGAVKELNSKVSFIDINSTLYSLLPELGYNEIGMNNLNLAFHTAINSGLEVPYLLDRITTWQPPANRVSLIEAIGNSILIDDSYTNDLAALQGAIKFAKKNAQGKKLKAIVTSLEGEVNGEDVLATLLNNGFEDIITIGKGFNEPSYSNVLDLIKNIHIHDLDNAAILVKGLHHYDLKEVVHFLKAQKNVTKIQIYMDKLRSNFLRNKAILSDRTKVLLMLKAEAYGSGIHRWLQLIEEIEPDYIGVAHVDEGVQLRQLGLTKPILVLYSRSQDLNTIAAYDLEPLIYDHEQLQALCNFSSSKIKFHLEIDTGMHRLGFYAEDIGSVIYRIKQSVHNCVGVMSHLSSADDPSMDGFTRNQIKSFEETSNLIEKTLEKELIKHLANSSGIVRFKNAHFDMVRLGIGIFGIHDPETSIFTWKTEIAQVKTVPPGEGIGYGSLEASPNKRAIAIIPVGYADGFDRGLGNGKWQVIVNNTKCPTVGNICMDMTMIDVTGIKCKKDEEVILMGPKNDTIEMAEVLQTIPYEIISRIAPRVNREYVSE
jgi:alanine racemase